MLLRQDFLFLPDKAFPVCCGLPDRHLLQYPASPRLHRLCDLPGHLIRHCSMPSRVREYMNFIKIHAFEKAAALLKLLVGLPWKSHNHICSECRPVIIAAQPVHRRKKLCRRVMAVHPRQYAVAAALQGEVKMRTDFRFFRDGGDKFLAHHARLQRAEPDPLYALHTRDGAEQRQQSRISAACLIVGNILPVQAVAPDMNSGDHNLPDALCRKPLYFLQHLLRAAAPHPASRVGNNTIGTELIAPVLNFDIRAGPPGRPEHHGFIGRMMLDVVHGEPAQRFIRLPVSAMNAARRTRIAFLCRFQVTVSRSGSILCGSAILLHPFPQICLDDLRDLALAVCSDGQINRGILLHTLGVSLHITADCDHHGIRVDFLCAMQHLPALPVRDIRDRTGIDDIDVRRLIKRHNLPAFFL